MRKLQFIFLLFALSTSISLMAQRERNYIYLLDCTRSMIGYGGSPDIWQSTKNYLKNELEKHSPGTTLHVIPFQGKVLPAYSFMAGNMDWGKMEKDLGKIVQNITNTNICEAWDAIDGYIDKHKDNYIILLTDGKDNVNGMEAVGKKLSDWCGKFPNTYAFYVQLTKDAIDTNVANVINICDNEYVVDASDGSIPVFGGFDNGIIIYANTLNLNKTHLLGFSSAGRYVAHAVCNDPYFDIKVVDNIIEGGIVPIQITAKMAIADINAAIPETYNFTFDVQSNEVNIINPTVKVQMTNKPERALDILSEESSMGKASWYDSFLIWGASEPDTLSINLKAEFNNEAQKDGASIQLQIKDADGNDDFQIFYDGKAVENGSFIINQSNSAPSILSVVFNAKAKQGTRYLNIKATAKNELDKVNDQPVDNYALTLRSKYEVNWNPLKTTLMWLAILILAALMLWFLFIKRLFFPSISVKTIQINDPYFSKVNVKGKRRVVFTNKNMEQGLMSKIFTGEILYKTNSVWTFPLAFEPGVKKKTLRVMKTKNYVFNPYTSTLKAPNDYVIENVNDKTKIKITIN